jgi:glc operon protein GlcG
MTKMLTAAAAATFMLAPLMADAQQPPAPIAYGMPISLEVAKKVLAAAEAEAHKNNWPVAIAIVDTSAKLVAFSKIDNTQHVSVDIAIGKATTAVNFKRPTKAMQEAMTPGGANLRILAVPGVFPIEGGLPIMVDGKIVGGIGTSGVMANQDGEVSAAGLAAVAK